MNYVYDHFDPTNEPVPSEHKNSDSSIGNPFEDEDELYEIFIQKEVIQYFI